MCLYVTHATRALQSHDLSGESINSGSHTYFIWPHNDMEGLPGWGIRSIPRPPPRQHEQSNKANMKGWLLRPKDTVFGDLVGLKLPDICLTGEKKSRKNLAQETCPYPGWTRVRCVTGAHPTACSTVVDQILTLNMEIWNSTKLHASDP